MTPLPLPSSAICALSFLTFTLLFYSSLTSALISSSTHPGLFRELLPYSLPGLSEYFSFHSSSSSSSPDVLRQRFRFGDPLHPDSTSKSHVNCRVHDFADFIVPSDLSSSRDDGLVIISIASLLQILGRLLTKCVDEMLELRCDRVDTASL